MLKARATGSALGPVETEGMVREHTMAFVSQVREHSVVCEARHWHSFYFSLCC